MKRIAGILTVLALAATLTGCWTTRWPYGMSLDRHNFISTPSMPLTVVLRDTVTKEDLLRLEVPVGQELVIDLEHEADRTPALTRALPAESVSWEFFDVNRKIPVAGQLKHEMDLPGNNVLLKVVVREPVSAEAPEGMAPAPGAGMEPAVPIYTPPAEAEEGPAEGDDEAGPDEAGDGAAEAEGEAEQPDAEPETGDLDEALQGEQG